MTTSFDVIITLFLGFVGGEEKRVLFYIYESRKKKFTHSHESHISIFF